MILKCHNTRPKGGSLPKREVLLLTGSGLLLLPLLLLSGAEGAISGYKETPTQYHIQTDEGNERFFRYQTFNGQYRKERRLDDGTVVGSYGWVDPTGFLRMTDYIADSKGYRVVKNSMKFVGTNSILPAESPKVHHHQKEAYTPRKIGRKVPLSKRGKVPFKIVKKRVGGEFGSNALASTNTESRVSLEEKPAILVVYGPLRSANVHSARLVTRRKVVPQQQSTAQTFDDKEEGGDVFQKYATPVRKNGRLSASFIYKIPNQYHKEQTDSGGERKGSFGYVDPFGIRRVIHYGTVNGTFNAARDFKYVGTQY